MALTMIIRRMYSIRELLNTNLSHKIPCMCNANIHSFKPFKMAPILRNKLTYLVPKRNIYRLFRRPTKEQLRIKDNVPDEYKLIYRNTMYRYILYAQIFTTASAFILISLAVIKHDFSNLEVDFSNWKNPPRHAENDTYIYIGAFIFFVVALQVLVSRLPIRIYNLPQQKKYIFVFYGNYPFTLRKLTCKVGEVVPLPESKLSLWKQGRYLVKDEHKLILVDHYFRRSADLYIMLGVQRDPDVEE